LVVADKYRFKTHLCSYTVLMYIML